MKMTLLDHLHNRFDSKSFISTTFEQHLDFLESFQMEVYFQFKKAEVHPAVINTLLQFFSSERKNVGTKRAHKNNLVYHYVVTSALHHFVDINPSEEFSSRLLFAFVALDFNHPDICDHYGREIERIGKLPIEEESDFLLNLYKVMNFRPANSYSATSESLGNYLYKKVLYLDE